MPQRRMYSCERPQCHPAWPNGPVGADCFYPVHFPSLPGDDYLSSAEHNGGLFIPPTYDSYSPTSHTSCHLMWQSTPGGHAYPIGQFFEPGQACFIPHESQYMFLPPGYCSSPAPFNMQHHWNNGSGEQTFPSSCSPDESATDYQTDATEYCLSNNNAEQYLFPETCEAGLAPPHCQEMPACSVEQLDVTAENMHFDNMQNQPTWPNEPVGASHVSPLLFPSLPGSDCFSPSGHNGGLFIPPTYDSNSPSPHMSCHLMWQSTPGGHDYPMGQFFEPGLACFIPHESKYMFLPPGYSSSPAPFNMQHHWNNGSGEQTFPSSCSPDESATDYQTNATEYCLSNNNAEQYLFPETCEAGLAPPHCQEMPACSVEQLDVTAENMHFDNMQNQPTWPNEPVGASHVSPLLFPSLPGSDCFSPSGHNGGLFIPPTYDSNSPSPHMSCHLMWQSTPGGHDYPMGQFFEPGLACFIPHESKYMFLPPGYSSSPAPFNMQHHWNNGSGEQTFPSSCSPDESATDYQTNATEYCLSNNNAEQYLFPETCEAGLAPPHCQEMPACSVEQLDVTAENMHFDNMQNQPTWPNEPVGASHVSPLLFPSLPGSDCFSPSGHNGGLFIPPTYDSNSPSPHMSCHLMWQSTPGGHDYPMGQFFEPGLACFIPHESQYMFLPPGYSSSPAPFNMQHHWNNGSGEQTFPSSCSPDESATDYQTNATEYCLSNNNAEQYLFPETCEAGLAPPHCQEMPACSVEQLDVTAENMHFDNMQNQLTWPNEPVGASHVSPLLFPSLPGSDCFSPSGHNGGLFIPPTYDSNSPSPHMQHHWNNFSGEQNFPSSSSPVESSTDYLTDASENCLSSNNVEPYLLTETCEAGLAPPHCQEMPACSVEQLEVTAENMHLDDIQTKDLEPRNIQEERPSKSLSEKTIFQHDGVIIIWEIEMPQPIAEQFIGKEGQYLKFVMQHCGGLVYMSQHPRVQDDMLCNIMGTKQQVQKALDLIRKRVKSLNLKNVYSAPCVTFGDHLNETPSRDKNGVSVFQTKPESS